MSGADRGPACGPYIHRASACGYRLQCMVAPEALGNPAPTTATAYGRPRVPLIPSAIRRPGPEHASAAERLGYVRLPLNRPLAIQKDLWAFVLWIEDTDGPAALDEFGPYRSEEEARADAPRVARELLLWDTTRPHPMATRYMAVVERAARGRDFGLYVLAYARLSHLQQEAAGEVYRVSRSLQQEFRMAARTAARERRRLKHARERAAELSRNGEVARGGAR